MFCVQVLLQSTHNNWHYAPIDTLYYCYPTQGTKKSALKQERFLTLPKLISKHYVRFSYSINTIYCITGNGSSAKIRQRLT